MSPYEDFPSFPFATGHCSSPLTIFHQWFSRNAVLALSFEDMQCDVSVCPGEYSFRAMKLYVGLTRAHNLLKGYVEV